MKYNELNINKSRSAKRVGRGIAAGQGKTAGRGTKGQKARTGYSRRPGFEGGQNPLSQRFPKLRGFRSHRTKAEIVYTDDLALLGATVTNEVVAEAGLVSSAHVRVKVLSRGDYKKKQTIKLQAASGSAVKAIETAGGSFTSTPRVGRPKTAKEKQV